MTKRATKNLKASLICLGLVTIAAVYVSAFTFSMASESKISSPFAMHTKSITSATASHIGTSTLTHTSTSTSTSTSTTTTTLAGIGTEVEEISGISVFPNPVVDKLNIKYAKDAGAVTKIKILNVSGACVLVSEKTDVVDMSKLAAGSYFVQFVDANLHTTTKSVVKTAGAQ